MAKKKKTPAARYAFIGLIVALLACIAAGLLGLLKGVAGLQMFTPPDPDLLDRALYASIAVIVLGLAAYAIMAPDSVRRFLTGRQARYGSNALIMSLAFAGILFVANYLVYQYPQSLDFTEDKSHTLAPETLQALATLPDQVSAVAFFTSPDSTAEQLLQDFKANSRGKFTYQFVNPDLNPISAREAGVTGNGKIMLVMGERKEIASYANETELTRTLIRLISPGERVVYFLSGHGERDTTGGGEAGLSIARDTLESKNYTIKSLNLLAANEIPDDALAVIIAGPQKPLTSQEVSLLKNYAAEGGSLVVMEDPPVLTEFGEAPDPLASYLASNWGIRLNNDVIIDLTSQNPLQAVSASASQTHPITQNLTYNYAVILPQARSLTITDQPEGVTQTAILLTSEQSWGETEYADTEGGELAYTEGKDTLGPLNMAVAAENTNTKGRVVVFGNSVFATDQAFDAYGNGNIFINSVDWAAEQEDLINITPRESISRTFTPPGQIQFVIILIGSIFVIPGLVLAAGISSWLSRRKRG